MTPSEYGVSGGEISPFLGDAPLLVAPRTELDSFLGEESTGRLDTPWLSEAFLMERFAAEDEVWSDSSEQIEFRERVLAAHIERSRKALGKRTPLRNLRDDELASVAGTGIRMRADAAAAAGRMIKAANAALASAQTAGDESANVTTRITANSGYRGRDYQRGLWLDYFRGYYNETRKARERLEAGLHSGQAVSYMLNTFGVPDKIAAPGYSNHQAGIAIDLLQKRKDGYRVKNSSSPGWRETWRKTWFHQWLRKHAASFGFVPYWKEEWHWEYKPAAAAKLQGGESPDEHELGLQEAESCEADEVSEEQERASDPSPFPQRQGTSREPVGKTHYEGIDLKIGSIAVQVLIQKQPEKKYKTVKVAVKPKTGIFIPDGYRAGAALDLVVYLHGHTKGYPGRNASIAEYWNDPKRYFALREQVNESGKNVVLVAPTLGPHSEAGSLDDAGGLDSFVGRVLKGLENSAAFTNRLPPIRSIILAGHSGAGAPMLRIALSRSSMAAKIRECWLFDALYGGVSGWEKWIRANPDGVFYSYHAGGSPTNNSRRLENAMRKAGLPNAFVIPSTGDSPLSGVGHFQVPMNFFPARLRETSWLDDRRPPVQHEEEWLDGETEELDQETDEALDDADEIVVPDDEELAAEYGASWEVGAEAETDELEPEAEDYAPLGIFGAFDGESLSEDEDEPREADAGEWDEEELEDEEAWSAGATNIDNEDFEEEEPKPSMSTAARDKRIAAAITQATTKGERKYRAAMAEKLRMIGTGVEEWFGDLVPDATFLGIRIERSRGSTVPGVHRTLLDVLQEAERLLLANHAGSTLEKLRTNLKVRRVTGLRPPDGYGNHPFGLAIDINPDTNPYIGNMKGKTIDYWIHRSPRRIERAMWLVHGEPFHVEEPLKAKDAAEAWTMHKRASEALAKYLRLADDLEAPELAALIAKAQPLRLKITKREEAKHSKPKQPKAKQPKAKQPVYLIQTPEEWKHWIKLDRQVVKKWDLQNSKHPEKTGYMDLPRDLVVALTKAGLRWGGQFNFMKDIMHFDLPKEIKDKD